MAWVEQVERRGRKEKHYRDDLTGQFRAEFTVHDQHYQDSNSQWQDVNESLTDDGLDGFAKKCDTTQHVLRLGSGGTRRWYPRRNVTTEYVDITGIEYYSNRWRILNLPAAVWKSNGADWDMANLYAAITNTWRKIKTDFILKDATAPTRLRFAISLTGLTLGADWKLTSALDGQVVGYIDPPNAWYGDAAHVLGTPVPVTATYAGGYIEWSVDTTGASYPVYVDPTFTDGPSGDVTTSMDTFLSSSPATNNFGASLEYDIGVWSSTNINRGLVQFNVSSLAGSSITSGTLTLTDTRTYIGAGTVKVHRGLTQWYEGAQDGATPGAGEDASVWSYRNYNGSVAWGAAGGQSGTDYAASQTTSQVINGTGAYNFDVTADVTAWAGGSNNYGLWLINSVEGANSDQVFATSDNGTSASRPKLVVIYGASGGTNITTAEATQTQASDAVGLTYQGSTPFGYDAFSNVAGSAGTALVWTHTPNGTPKGAVVFVAQNIGTTNEVTGVSYGTLAMTQIAKSPVIGNTTEGGVAYGYFAGTNLPTGAQTITVSVNGSASSKVAGCFTVTGPTDTQVINSGTINNVSLGTPTVNLALGGTSAFVAVGFHAGPNAPTGITPLAGWSETYEFDYGSQVAGIYKYDTVGTADVSAGFQQAADDVHLLAVAISSAVTVSQWTITPSEGSQGQTSDAVSLKAITPLTVQEAAQGQASDPVTLSLAVPQIPVDGGEQSQRSDAVTLQTKTPLVTGEAAQTQTSDIVTLVTLNALTVSEGSQSQAGDAVILNALTPLAVGETAQAQTGDAVTLKTITPLVVGEAVQSQTSDVVGLTYGNTTNLTATEAAQGQTSDAVTLSFTAPSYTITVAEASQTQVSDAVTLTFQGISTATLTIAEGAQTQVSDPVTLNAVTKLTAGEATQAQISDVITLTTYAPSYTLTIGEAFQGQTSDAITARGITPITIGEARQSQTVDPVTIILAALVLHGARRLYRGARRTDYTVQRRKT